MSIRSDVLGVPIPNIPHAISVSLPTWNDNTGYVEGDKRVTDAMVTGYPRFVVHRDIQALAGICEKEFGRPGETCFLFPSAHIANEFRQFMIRHSPDPASPIFSVDLVEYFICPTHGTPAECLELYIGLFQEDAFRLGKQFWQHTGLGISSRFASAVLDRLAQNGKFHTDDGLSPTPEPQNFQCAKHCDSKPRRRQTLLQPCERNTLSEDHCALRASAALAKATLRHRIAGLIANESPSAPVERSQLGASVVSEDDVFLFPTGMSAIWNSYQLILAIRPQQRSVCFGFPYTDTLKILEKWGPGCHFFADGKDTEIDKLSLILQTESISALYTESPSNPLLRSVNLPRLRQLADEHDFLLVVDETIGSFVNVDVLPYADMIVTSLSKVFSGKANVTGGSLVMNPRSKYYRTLKSQLEQRFEDNWWPEDAIVMEHNSRDLPRRVQTMNQTAESLCEFLRDHALSTPHTVLKHVYYPKWETRDHYDRFKRPEGGFSGLFTLTFTTMAASRAFFDNLDCAKGPSLGTNFTLVCPYTILAHPAELEWAETYGVETGLVRVSVGLEELEDLLSRFRVALDKAEATCL
ncbi:unnamed protein product [Rhizoctonia solani]|uniref:Cystathionine gamma-synthase n=1 Tax=Rhizoctonia solani TaxID=456999 RepID=A0A8H3GJS1_9AGAM|nr:unnamed protein product [Rhizoctonia solani]